MKPLPGRKLSRRSFFSQVTSGVAASGFLAVVGLADLAEAQEGRGQTEATPRWTGRTDKDSGPRADRPNFGLTGPRTSNSVDGDSGNNRDASVPTRSGRSGRRTGITDTDAGPRADPARHGRSGLTDHDPGDEAGYGRNGPCPRGYTRVVDADRGRGSDPIGPCSPRQP